MAVKTHVDFKSLYPSITTAIDIEDELGEPIVYQYLFPRQTTPMEMREWDFHDLQNIKIDMGNVDRLYHLDILDIEGEDREFEFIGRIQYEYPLYVQMWATCDCEGFESYGEGFIYVCKDADLFMNLVLNEKHNIDLIYEFLLEDGIKVEKSYNWKEFLEAKKDYKKFCRGVKRL